MEAKIPKIPFRLRRRVPIPMNEPIATIRYKRPSPILDDPNKTELRHRSASKYNDSLIITGSSSKDFGSPRSSSIGFSRFSEGIISPRMYRKRYRFPVGRTTS